MIEHPVALTCALIAIVAAVIVFSKTAAGARFFKFLPVPFYCYFIPILGATAGLFPEKSIVYKLLSQHVLPPCLILLLLGSPWTQIARVGRQAILAMAAGTIGMILGAIAGYLAVRKMLPPEFWMAAGALLGSWTGGSANMLAVKEALSMPDSLLAPMIIVDTIMAYSWMAILVAMAGYQAGIDRILGADRRTLEQARHDAAESRQSTASRWLDKAIMVVAAVLIGEICLVAGKQFAQWMPQLAATAWTVMLATTAGLILSLTPASRWESAGASNMGITVLLLLLASYGAQSNIRAIIESPQVLIFGIIMVAVHGAVLIVCGFAFRLPLFYLATASQACIGGPVSTPIVAGVYQPSLTHVGVILALLGGAIGTYVGLLGAAICRWLG